MKQRQKDKQLSLARKLLAASLAGALLLVFSYFVFQNLKGSLEIEQLKIEKRQDARAEIVSPDGPFFGFGSSAVGGKGKPVFLVKNLNDSGSGSLREALKSGDKIIKFNVSGEIALQSELFIPSNVTVDGLSAPSPGITIKNDRVTVRESKNIIIQGIRFRGPAYDNLRIWYGANNIVVDHCSFGGSLDGGLDVTEGAHDITLSWNIIANTAGEGKAMLIKYGTYHISLHHNVFVNNDQRNPQIAGDDPDYYKGTLDYRSPTVDLRNNLIWNWNNYGTWVTSYSGFIGSANIVNNLYSSQTRPQNALIVHADDATAPAQAYVSGNISLTNVGAAKQYLSNLLLKDINEVSNHSEFSAPNLATAETGLESAHKALSGAGVRPLDDIDKAELLAIKLPELSNQKPPVAKAGEDLTVDVGKEIIFDGSASYDPENGKLNYLWNFEDGQTASTVVSRYAYQKDGIYDVKLTVTDEFGLSSDDSLWVVVASENSENPEEKNVLNVISSGVDDGYEYGSNALNLVSTAMNLGKGTKNAFRFQKVNVPKGAVIKAAYLELYCSQYEGKSISLEYFGELSSNSSGLDKVAYGISQKKVTQQKINDAPLGWKRNSYNNSPNLSPVIQEIINQDGWINGNAMTLLISGSNSIYYRQIKTKEGNNPPRLNILYE